jgi:hypothetical protein
VSVYTVKANMRHATAMTSSERIVGWRRLNRVEVSWACWWSSVSNSSRVVEPYTDGSRFPRWFPFALCTSRIFNRSVPSVHQRPVEVPGQVRTLAEGLVAGASAVAHRDLGG